MRDISEFLAQFLLKSYLLKSETKLILTMNTFGLLIMVEMKLRKFSRPYPGK